MAEKETRHQAYLTVYFCGSENCPPRHAYGPAVRPHYLLHVILKGRGIYQYKGQTYAPVSYTHLSSAIPIICV